MGVLKFKQIFKAMARRPTSDPPYSHIVQIGDPILRHRTEELPVDTIKTPEVQTLIKHMVDTMRSHKLVGLACNQIGMPYRILTMEFKEALRKEYTPALYATREMQTLPLTIVVNAKLSPTNFDQVTHPEGCGSVKGYSGEVSRFKAILLEGFDENGEKVAHNLSGWNARIAQHEVDHLDGVLYTDKMDRKTFQCSSWEDINKNAGRVTLQYMP